MRSRTNRWTTSRTSFRGVGTASSPSRFPSRRLPAAALLALGPEVGDRRDHDATVDALLASLDSVPVTGAVDPDAIHVLLTVG